MWEHAITSTLHDSLGWGWGDCPWSMSGILISGKSSFDPTTHKETRAYTKYYLFKSIIYVHLQFACAAPPTGLCAGRITLITPQYVLKWVGVEYRNCSFSLWENDEDILSSIQRKGSYREACWDVYLIKHIHQLIIQLMMLYSTIIKRAPFLTSNNCWLCCNKSCTFFSSNKAMLEIARHMICNETEE